MISVSYIEETKVMRTLVDLGDAQLQALDELSKKEKRSRAALIRRAIDDYLAKQADKQEDDAFRAMGQTPGRCHTIARSTMRKLTWKSTARQTQTSIARCVAAREPALFVSSKYPIFPSSTWAIGGVVQNENPLDSRTT